jgi:hypothetical protein
MQSREVTKAIVRDLLPVYLAGDASADTRVVVEEFLAKDAELREIAEAGNISLPPLEAPPSLEAQSLERTQRLLGRKNFWLGFALIFCSAPLIMTPFWLADIVMLIGLGGWVPFLMACKELGATGLQASRGWIPRVLWMETGFLIGYAAGCLIDLQLGRHWGDQIASYLGCLGFGLASWLGERYHRIQTVDDLTRPITLFGKQ